MEGKVLPFEPLKSLRSLLAWLADAVGRRLTLRRVVLGAIVFVLLIGFGTPALLDWMIARQLAAIVALAPEAGAETPVVDLQPQAAAATWDELAEEVHRVERQYLRELGEKAFSILRSSAEDMPPIGQPWDHLEAAKALLRRYDKTFDLLAAWQSSQAPNKLGDLDLNELRYFRELLRAIILRFNIEVAESHFDEAFRTTELLVEIARSTEMMPSKYGSMFRISVESQIRSCLLRIAPYVRDPAKLRSLQHSIRQKLYEPESWNIAVRNARDISDRVENGRATSTDVQPIRWLHAQTSRMNLLLWLREERALLETVRNVGWITALQIQPPEPIREFEPPWVWPPKVTWQDKWAWSQKHPGQHPRPWRFHTALCLSLRCLDAAIGIALFEHDHGRLPESMAELIPDYYPAEAIDGIRPEWISFRSTDTAIVIKGAIPGLHPDVPVAVRTEMEMKRRNTPETSEGKR